MSDKKTYDRQRYLNRRTALLAEKRATYSATEQRRKNLWRKFKITPERYGELLAAQGGMCAICESSDGRGRHKILVVDHCHLTGEVRGLLCTPCNVGLGALGDTEKGLARALAYVKKCQI